MEATKGTRKRRKRSSKTIPSHESIEGASSAPSTSARVLDPSTPKEEIPCETNTTMPSNSSSKKFYDNNSTKAKKSTLKEKNGERNPNGGAWAVDCSISSSEPTEISLLSSNKQQSSLHPSKSRAGKNKKHKQKKKSGHCENVSNDVSKHQKAHSRKKKIDWKPTTLSSQDFITNSTQDSTPSTQNSKIRKDSKYRVHNSEFHIATFNDLQESATESAAGGIDTADCMPATTDITCGTNATATSGTAIDPYPAADTITAIASSESNVEESEGRQLHSCPEPWHLGVENAPVQLYRGRAQCQPYHRQILALLNRLTDASLDFMVQKAVAILQQPRPCGSTSALCGARHLQAAVDSPLSCRNCCAAAVPPSQLLATRRDLVTMLLVKAQEEDLFIKEYCKFLQGVFYALEEHDEELIQDIASLQALAARLQEVPAFSAGRAMPVASESLRASNVPFVNKSHEHEWVLLPSIGEGEGRPSSALKESHLQEAIRAEEARHLLRGAQSFRDLLQEECMAHFHALLLTLTVGHGASDETVEAFTRRNIKCFIRLMMELHYSGLLQLQQLLEVRDAVARPLETAYSHSLLPLGENAPQDGPVPLQYSRVRPTIGMNTLVLNHQDPVLLSVELLCSVLQALGPCNNYNLDRTNALCQLLDAVLPVLPVRHFFLVWDVLDSWISRRFRPLTSPAPLRSG